MKMENLLGVVICGGKSSRMGIDKSTINYHGEEQRYFLYKMLERFCSEVVISDKVASQWETENDYKFVVDGEQYQEAGPMAGLISAHHSYPNKNILLVACDYPLLQASDLQSFLLQIKKDQNAAAFFNKATGFYEPLLAYYSVKALTEIETLLNSNHTSLQKYLNRTNAKKFVDYDFLTLRSVDDPKSLKQVKEIIAAKSKDV